MKKTAAAAVLGGAFLAAGGMSLAHAAPPAQPVQSLVGDGKVDVAVTAGGQEIGVLQDVSLENADALAAATCPVAGISPETLKALDTNGTEVPGPCNSIGAVTYTFTQNAPGNSETAPGQNKPASASSSNAATPTSPSDTPAS
jgi:hypothetical protein